MTVTITINNNYNYIKENSPELIEVDEESACEFYPFEINIANGSFSILWKALKLVAIEENFSEWCCGTISAVKFYNLLKKFNPSSITYDAYQSGIVYDCGINLQRATRYYWNLMTIAKEAIKRNEEIVWY